MDTFERLFALAASIFILSFLPLVHYNLLPLSFCSTYSLRSLLPPSSRASFEFSTLLFPFGNIILSLTVVMLHCFYFPSTFLVSHSLPFGNPCIFSCFLNMGAFSSPSFLLFHLLVFLSILLALSIRQLFILSLVPWPPLSFGLCRLIAF